MHVPLNLAVAVEAAAADGENDTAPAPGDRRGFRPYPHSSKQHWAVFVCDGRFFGWRRLFFPAVRADGSGGIRGMLDTNNDGQITSDDKLTWQDAVDYCDGLTYVGFSDWHLPSLFELTTIVNYGRDNPAIDTTYII